MKFRGGAKSFKFGWVFLIPLSADFFLQENQNLRKVNLGTTVTYRLRHMSSFQCLQHQPVFPEKQLLYLRWLVFCGILQRI